MEPDERLLHEVFGGGLVVAEHAGETDERPALFGEQVGDERVRVDGSRRDRGRQHPVGAHGRSPGSLQGATIARRPLPLAT